MEELFEINQIQNVLKREVFLDNCMNSNKWIKIIFKSSNSKNTIKAI
jgi:hypothetical protein